MSGTKQTPVNSQSRIRRVAQIAAIITLTVLSVYGALELVIRIHDSARNPKLDKTVCDCGNSIADALSLGCKFVPMAAAWLPPACRDEKLSAEFDNARPGPNSSWSYHADKPDKRELSLSQVAGLADVRGEHYYTTMEWHIVHCVYYWKKLHRARRTGVVIEPRYDSEKHIDHCLKMFLSTMKRDRIATRQIAGLHSSVL